MKETQQTDGADTQPANLYEATKVNLNLVESEPAFYVVGRRKFWLLYIFTLGIYPIYWFYTNWRRYKADTGSDLWPVPRAVFSIFFTHALGRAIDARLRVRQIAVAWTSASAASTWVALEILSNVLSRLSWKEIGTPWVDILGFALLPLLAWALWPFQRAINAACDDPNGESNSALTPANIVWMVLGGLLGVAGLIGLMLPPVA
jgi:hypothetical protein